jgi:probable phosphoglycerate mutase
MMKGIATEMLLIRHAQTESLNNGLIHGQTDSPLSRDGILAAEKTAAYFRGQTFHGLYASSLGRAMRTAAIIGEAINKQPVAVDGLQEQYYGWLEGKPGSWFNPEGNGKRILKPLVKLAMKTTGEPESRYFERVTHSVDKIIAAHTGQSVMLVVHWGILCILLRYLQGEPLEGCLAPCQWTACGITELHLNSHGWRVIRLNDSSHLKI